MNFASLFNFILFFSISIVTPFYYREILSYLNLPFLHALMIMIFSFILSLIMNSALGGFLQLFNFICGYFLAQQKIAKPNIHLTKIPSPSNFSNHYQLLFLILILSISYSFAYALTFLCYSISELDFTVICSLAFSQMFSTFFNFIFFHRKLPILGFLALLSISSGLFTILYNFRFLHSNFCYACHATNLNIPFQNHYGEKKYQILTQVLASFFVSLSNFLFAKTINHVNEKFFIPNDYNTMQYNPSTKHRNTFNSLVHIVHYWVVLLSIIFLAIMYFTIEFQNENLIKFSNIFNIDYITLILFGVALNELKMLSEVKLLETTGWHFSIPFSKLRILPILLINIIILNNRFRSNIRLPTENSQLSFQFPLNLKKNYAIEQIIGTFFIIAGTVFLSLTTDNNYSFIASGFNNNYNSSDDIENVDNKKTSNSSTVGNKGEVGLKISMNSNEDEFSSLLRIEDNATNDHEEHNKDDVVEKLEKITT